MGFCVVLHLLFLVSRFLFCFCSQCVVVFCLYVFPMFHLLSLCFMFPLFQSLSCFHVSLASLCLYKLSCTSCFTLVASVLCQCFLLCFPCLVMSDQSQPCLPPIVYSPLVTWYVYIVCAVLCPSLSSFVFLLLYFSLQNKGSRFVYHSTLPVCLHLGPQFIPSTPSVPPDVTECHNTRYNIR